MPQNEQNEKRKLPGERDPRRRDTVTLLVGDDLHTAVLVNTCKLHALATLGVSLSKWRRYGQTTATKHSQQKQKNKNKNKKKKKKKTQAPGLEHNNLASQLTDAGEGGSQVNSNHRPDRLLTRSERGDGQKRHNKDERLHGQNLPKQRKLQTNKYAPLICLRCGSMGNGSRM